MLNGTETWSTVNTTIWGNNTYLCTTIPSAKAWGSTVSNYFVDAHLNGAGAILQNGQMQMAGSGLVMRNDSTTSANDFKTWLTTNNVTVYYVLATPTYTEITDTYLINQLNALKDISLYDTLCYVDWVGIEKPTMSLLYSGTEDLGIKYIITEDGKKIRTDWRKLGRRKNGR